MPLRVVLRKCPYAILMPGLSYSTSVKASGMFTHYIPTHDSHRRWGTEDVGGAEHVTVSIVNGCGCRLKSVREENSAVVYIWYTGMVVQRHRRIVYNYRKQARHQIQYKGRQILILCERVFALVDKVFLLGGLEDESMTGSDCRQETSIRERIGPVA